MKIAVLDIYKKMHPAWKDAWVHNLRSGNYNQGVGRLVYTDEWQGHVNKEYCALGVLVDTVNGKVEDFSLTGVRDTVGLEVTAANMVIYLNDQACADFSQIADWIESHL